VIETADGASARVRGVAEILGANADRLAQASGRAVDDVDKAGTAFNDRSHDLANASDRAAQLLSLVTEVMRRQAEDLGKASGEASAQMNAVAGALQERTEQLEHLQTLLFGLPDCEPTDRVAIEANGRETVERTAAQTRVDAALDDSKQARICCSVSFAVAFRPDPQRACEPSFPVTKDFRPISAFDNKDDKRQILVFTGKSSASHFRIYAITHINVKRFHQGIFQPQHN